MVCAAWMKPRARSENFSKSMCSHSLSGTPRPPADAALVRRATRGKVGATSHGCKIATPSQPALFCRSPSVSVVAADERTKEADKRRTVLGPRRARCRAGPSGGGGRIGEDNRPAAQRLGGEQGERHRRALSEKPPTAPEDHRHHRELDLVDQAFRQQRADELGAPEDIDGLLRLRLQRPQRAGDVGGPRLFDQAGSVSVREATSFRGRSCRP